MVNQPGVSWLHCEIKFSPPGGLALRDVSTNGVGLQCRNEPMVKAMKMKKDCDLLILLYHIYSFIYIYMILYIYGPVLRPATPPVCCFRDVMYP